MNTTLKLLRRKKRLEEEANKKAQFIETIKKEALKYAKASNKSSYFRPEWLQTATFGQYPPDKQIAMIEDYLARMKELEADLRAKLAGVGKETAIYAVNNRIDAAVELLIEISIANLDTQYQATPAQELRAKEKEVQAREQRHREEQE